MSEALKVRKTGEMYRLVDSRWKGSTSEGSIVACYNALVWKSRTGARREYDAMVEFSFQQGEHEIIEARPNQLLDQEIRRGKELVCRRFHRHKCEPVGGVLRSEKVYKSVVRDEPGWLDKEVLRLLKLAGEYLEKPSMFDRTKLSVLRFDLVNGLSLMKKRIGDGGINGGGREGTAGNPPA